ncbi:MAG: hypothetical protein QM426_11235 [Euryarchaeota archaeon]|nr:hypothetical protein [Euryarchaeota archaeon]
MGVEITLKKIKLGKILIPLLLIPILFFYLLPYGSANESDKQLNNSDHNNDIPHLLPDYGPKAFEEAKKQFPGFITTRGRMPEIHQEKEKKKWIDLLINSSRSRSRPTGINPYLTVSGGPINSFGADINGYLIVSFDPSTPEKVNESVIDEIYQVINEHFEQEGISDVPVVFAFVQITDDLAPADEPDANESNNTNLSDNEKKTVRNETTNQTPSFTSLMVILGLLSLLIIKRST